MKIRDIDINYEQIGVGYDIVLLHGWGQNINTMKSLAEGLKRDFKVTIIDFPGFGSSDEPLFPWTVYDYANMLEELFNKLRINNPIIIGHSFGGRIAIVYAATRNVKKLVLLSAPYRKNNEKISAKVKIYKAVNKILPERISNYAKSKLGSTDYKNASEIMKKVLVNTVNENLASSAEKIKCPTLLIYGDNDTEVVFNQAQELEKMIKNSGLVNYEGCGHYAFLDRLNQTIRVLYSFFESERD